MSGPAAEGLLALDKPQGPTSHDLVSTVRRGLGTRRVGHTGTLDPMASGLMLIVVGRATRLARYLPHSPKTYSGSIELGTVTDTDDVTGKTIESHEGPLPESSNVLRAGLEMQGPGEQLPPLYSARKVEGQRMYRLARKGQRPRATPTAVDIHRFELRPTTSPRSFEFVAEVSAGTYIRSLARDLGRRLGCGAVLASLRRTRIGPIDVGSALRLDTDEERHREALASALVPPDRMPLEPRLLTLGPDGAARRFVFGSTVPVAGDFGAGLVRVTDPSGALLGIGEVTEGVLHPRVVLAADPGRA